MAIVNYPATGAALATVIGELAADYHLRLSRDAVADLANASGGDRGIIRQELFKLALFVDATPGSSVVIEVGDLGAVGASIGETDTTRLVNGVAGGNVAEVAAQLADLGGVSTGITLLRAVARRFWLLLDLRGAVDGGLSASRAVKMARPPIFFKEEAAIIDQLTRWRSPVLRTAIARLLDAERDVKRSGSAGDVAVNQMLLQLARQAAQR